jgi:D-sedoheptulose 7-phosphate isomerase
MTDPMIDYFDQFGRLIRRAVATDKAGNAVDITAALAWIVARTQATCAADNKLMFIGNGGSAAIASHMANDFSKNGGLPATAFNDPSVLTCIGNDLGYDNVFKAQIDWHARAGDFLVAISSSGRSPNILNGVAAARGRGCEILTLSGFAADNPLRGSGDMNIYVPSGAYGFVEIMHLAICHCVLDATMGLVRAASDQAVSIA